jgi:predicted SPOUT superfamily RNA methylase MTH1
LPETTSEPFRPAASGWGFFILSNSRYFNKSMDYNHQKEVRIAIHYSGEIDKKVTKGKTQKQIEYFYDLKG